MPKKIDWQRIKKDYLILKDSITLKDFAEKHNVKYSTLRSRKNREDWDNVASDDATQQKRKEHQKKIEIKENIKQLKDAGLNDKQQLFCIYYIECFNATKAYQKAYGCDYSTANANGSRLLVKDSIKKEIDRLTKECLKEQEIDSKLISKRVFQKYIDIAFADITDYMEFGVEDIPLMDNVTGKQSIDGEGNLIFYQRNYIYFKNNDEVDGTIISEIGQGKDGIKLKLQDKMKALNFLAGNISLLSSLDEVKIESEKAKVQKLQVEIDRLKNQDEEEVFEDDGFIDALKGEISEVWEDDDTEED